VSTLRWGAATHEGRVRTENEDAFATEPMVFVVADGMGGHQAGEVASAMAVQTLRERLQRGVSSVDVVIASVIEANAAIFHSAHLDATYQGMGTTLTALAVMPADDEHRELFALVNVGDSRTYRARAGKLERVTVDHSYVQELVATGHITEMEARNHPRRNIVTRALGIEPTVRVDSWVLDIFRGDRFMLCSDGLVDEVPDHEIELIMNGVSDPQAAADELVAMAIRHGGRDNVTVIVVDVLAGLELSDVPEVDVPPTVSVRVTDSGEVDSIAGGGVAEALSKVDGFGALALVPDALPLAADGLLPAARTDALGATRVGATTPQSRLGVAAPTTVQPAVAARRSRLTPGLFLFLFALGIIVTVTVTFVAVSLNSSDKPPATTVPDTTVPVTTAPATTAPVTTIASTTSPATTAAPTTLSSTAPTALTTAAATGTAAAPGSTP
jgi:serine/threonine protein phosphatase PrpC